MKILDWKSPRKLLLGKKWTTSAFVLFCVSLGEVEWTCNVKSCSTAPHVKATGQWSQVTRCHLPNSHPVLQSETLQHHFDIWWHKTCILIQCKTNTCFLVNDYQFRIVLEHLSLILTVFDQNSPLIINLIFSNDEEKKSWLTHHANHKSKATNIKDSYIKGVVTLR